MIQSIIAVAAGSALGGVARFLVSRWCASAWMSLPLGTLAVNVAGCLLIGLISGAAARCPALGGAWRLFLTVGFCGGFTTFSTFMNENWHLLTAGSLAAAALYAGASLALGLLAVWGGYALAFKI